MSAVDVAPRNFVLHSLNFSGFLPDFVAAYYFIREPSSGMNMSRRLSQPQPQASFNSSRSILFVLVCFLDLNFYAKENASVFEVAGTF